MKDNNDNDSDDTKSIIPIPNEKERKVMLKPTDDEILAAQGLLELSQEIRKFSDNFKSANSISTFNPFPPVPANIPANTHEFAYYESSPTYMPMTNLRPIDVNSLGHETGQKRSSTFPSHLPYVVPTHQITATDIFSGSERRQKLLPLLPRFAPTRQVEDEDIASIVVKEEEEEEENEEVPEGDEENMTKKRRFYINNSSKQRVADISYHRKKMDVRTKMERHRSI